MRQILFYTGIFLLLFTAACSKGPDALRKYGDETSVQRTLEPFHSIEVSQKFRLFLTNKTAEPEGIVIQYGSNVIDKIETRIEKGVLTIRDKNNFNWMRNLNVYPKCTLNIHNLQQITIKGSAEISCLDTLHIQGINITLDGVGSQHLLLNAVQVTGVCSNAGNVTLAGKGGLFVWTCENGSWIDAGNMECDDVYVYHYTGRDITVNANTILKAQVYGSGNVFYKKDPWYALEKNEYGTGKVLKK